MTKIDKTHKKQMVYKLAWLQLYKDNIKLKMKTLG
jgi:hypothetical protein